MSELSRKADQYWRSRTINEAQLQGYTGLRLTCGCGRITDYPFTLLLQRRGVTRHKFIGNIRFRCKNCGGNFLGVPIEPKHVNPKLKGWRIRVAALARIVAGRDGLA